MSFVRSTPKITALHPEMALGGFTAYDGTVEFYSRVKALTKPDMRVVDFGAGRGAWYEDEDSQFRRDMRLLKGAVREVIGIDVDPAVLENQAIDVGHVLEAGCQLPLEDASVDLIVSDYVFEHIENPIWLAAEFDRIVKPGGWICARTPTKYNYVSVAARLVTNIKHASVLRIAQPGRKAEDVFPTAYRLNSKMDVAKAFPPERFTDRTYIYCFEPQYHFGSVFVYRFFQFVHWLLPARLHGNLYIFLQKNGDS